MTGRLKNQVQMVNFDGCTTRRHSMPLNYTLRNGKFYGMYILTQLKKNETSLQAQVLFH